MSKQFKCTQCKQDFDISIKGKFQSEKITNKRTGEQSITIKHFCSEECKSLFDNPPKVKTDYSKLTDYILNLYIQNGYDKNYIPWNVLTAQISNMSSEHNYKYSGMKYALYYMTEIEELNLFSKESNGSVLSLIPFYYDKAKDFYLSCEEIKKDVANINLSDNVIKVVKSKLVRNKVPHFINMDEI